jgi:hypothetical protein
VGFLFWFVNLGCGKIWINGVRKEMNAGSNFRTSKKRKRMGQVFTGIQCAVQSTLQFSVV